MRLDIISADQVLFQGEVTLVTLPGELGSFTVLKNHASLISVLVPGNIVYKDENGQEHTKEVKGGIADIDNNVVSVCIY
ncbi:MAG: ATP synthase F1 subunit epsilon [Prevotella sp.]|nr:ATP synthase F1 subunit epsilon [Prevotella sp.]MCM1074922.1 ATP synthase F1 subunit epsilon [Ruminococcus sp.]